MNSLDETIIMSRFACDEQNEIAKELYAKYNTTHSEGIKAALNDAVWQGFCKGMDYSKKYYKGQE